MRTEGNHMSTTSATSSGSPALRFGALFGLGWGVLLIVNYYLVQSVGVGFLSLAALLISLVVYLVAGLLAAAQTGKTSTGLLAGLWTGLFSSLLNAVGVMILLLADHDLLEKVRQAGQNVVHLSPNGPGGPSPDQITLLYSATILIVGILVATLFGLALGALGGVAGKSTAQARGPALQSYRESMYQGISPTSPEGTPDASSPSSGDEKR